MNIPPRYIMIRNELIQPSARSHAAVPAVAKTYSTSTRFSVSSSLSSPASEVVFGLAELARRLCTRVVRRWPALQTIPMMLAIRGKSAASMGHPMVAKRAAVVNASTALLMTMSDQGGVSRRCITVVGLSGVVTALNASPYVYVSRTWGISCLCGDLGGSLREVRVTRSQTI